VRSCAWSASTRDWYTLLHDYLVQEGFDVTMLHRGDEVEPGIAEHEVDLVLDGGSCGTEPTTVVDLTGPTARIVRAGKGALAPLGLNGSQE